MKRLLILLAIITAVSFAAYQYAESARGCCSWHGGVCGCSNGVVKCCDGTFSKSCRC